MNGMQCGDLSSRGIVLGNGSGVVTTAAGVFKVVWGVGFPDAIFMALLLSLGTGRERGCW